MTKLTKKNIADIKQYWYSKYCNSIMKDERQIYLNLYKSYSDLDDYYNINQLYYPE